LDLKLSGVDRVPVKVTDPQRTFFEHNVIAEYRPSRSGGQAYVYAVSETHIASGGGGLELGSFQDGGITGGRADRRRCSKTGARAKGGSGQSNMDSHPAKRLPDHWALHQFSKARPGYL
jgi:hypothetical protein